MERTTIVYQLLELELGSQRTFKCTSMLNYGSYPLPDSYLEIRLTLANNLVNVHYYPTHFRDEYDQREIMKTFPKSRIPGLIIHKRFIINKDVICNDPKDNLCLECTFLLKGGEEDIRYTKALFRAVDVARYVQRTKSNLVVSLLHLTSNNSIN